VQVLDAATNAQLTSTPLNTSGTTTVDLTAVSAAAHPSIRVVFALQSTGQATPLVQSFTVSYTTQVAASLTLAASPLTVVFGKAVTLSGVLSSGSVPASGKPVDLSAEPFGASAFAHLATLTTDSTGAYSMTSKPTKQTVYEASAAGATAPPAVTVKVAQRLTLSVRRKGGKVYLKGSLGPKKRGRIVVLQVQSGKHWKKLGRVRTSKKSTFKLVRALSRGHAYKFRAKTAAYPGLLGGTSRIVRLHK
jgi:hypothetical protein